MVSNRFLEMNGVYNPPKPAPKPTPKPAPHTTTRFQEINDVYTPPAPVVPPPVTPQPAPPKPTAPTTTRFLEINGVVPPLQNLANGIGGYGHPTSGPSGPSPSMPYNYGPDPEGLLPIERATPPAPRPRPMPTPEAVMRADALLATEILAGRDPDKLHLINPKTGQEYTDDEINEVNQRLEIQKADQRVAREILAGRDADRMHFINPRTGSEYTDKEIAEIAGDIAANEQRNADSRIAREIIAGRDADRLHLINPETGREYTDAEIGDIAQVVDDHNDHVQNVADSRVAREIVAGRDADRMHFINPSTGQEYTDAEIGAIAERLEEQEQAQADNRVAQEVWAGRDADRSHFINPATGQEYTDAEIAAITDDVRAEQRAQLTPQFEAEVDKMVQDGTPRAVAETLLAHSFVQAGVPRAALPEGVEPFDPDAVFREDHDQFDRGRDLAQGDDGRIDNFVSLEDIDAIIANPDQFNPQVVATAMMLQSAVNAEGNEDLRANFVKKGWMDTIRDSAWLDPNSDSLVVNLVRGASGIPPSPAFINRVMEDGPGELRAIADSTNELSRFFNPVHNIVATGYDVATADDPMAALRAVPGEQLANYQSFGNGLLDWGKGAFELGVGAWALSSPVNAVMLEQATGINVNEEVAYAADGLARGFLTDPDALASGIVGYDMFKDDPIRWAGQQAPDIALEIATGGLGVAGKADDVLEAALDASKLPPPRLGQQTLFDADDFLNVPGQQRLFDPDDYLVTPDPIAAAPGAIPGQQNLFDAPTTPDLPGTGQQSLLDTDLSPNAELLSTTSPGGITAGFDYTPSVVANYPYGTLLRTIKGDPPANMFDPHAHHVLFKKGNGPAQQALVQEGQEILRRYDIDPIYGSENLYWAPNGVKGQHDIHALTPLVDELRALDATGLATREDFVEIIEKYASISAQRGPN